MEPLQDNSGNMSEEPIGELKSTENIVDNESSATTVAESTSSGEIGHAMQSYLRQLGKLPKLSPEEQDQLSEDILRAEEEWRNIVYGFGSVSRWHLDWIERWGNAQLREHIMPSCLMDEKANSLLPRWKRELKENFQELRNAFERGESEEVELFRDEIIAQLRKYSFSSDLVVKCHEKLLASLPKEDWRNSSNQQPTVSAIFTALAAQSFYTPEAFISRMKQAEAAREKLFQLRDRMVEANLRLVVSIVNKYSYHQVPVSDLVQEGNLGLIRSLEKFDFKLGHKFSTYASWWIKQSIGRALSEQMRIIRIPAHMIATIGAINRVEQRFILEHDREPEVEEIAAILEMPTPRVSAIRKMARQTISLQAPIVTTDTTSLEDMLPDEQSPDPFSAMSEAVLMENLQKLFDSLSEREREILAMRFGLMGHTVMTLQEISEHFNISRERVRQLELQTLNKLRTPENRKIFDRERSR